MQRVLSILPEEDQEVSSAHLIIVARNTVTNEFETMNGTTLYGAGGEEALLQSCRDAFTSDWVLTLYAPRGDSFEGTRKDGV